ncbi:MAG: HAD-IA family hydrolase [Pseudomonadales bacterium]|nr:HAD-IA family hydrolase [Pseudomonadales bacterium]
MIKAILWDFGGVITTSPFEAFNRFENQQGLPQDFIRGINSINPETNAWAQFESNQIDTITFNEAFKTESKAQGHEIPGKDVLALLSGDIRPQMVKAVQTCAKHFSVACLTNNVKTGTGPGMDRSKSKASAVGKVMALFDLVLESSKEGIRKPNPEFYQIACERLEIKPEQAIFLDDLGINLKPAKAMGMQTIKVLNESQALKALSTLTGLSLC